MAEILGKDLDLYDDSMIAEKPFNLAESEITGPQFMTGADLDRSTRISKEWKDPVAIPAQASVPYSTIGGIASVINRAAIDSVANLMPNMANQLAQMAIETDSGKEKSFAEKLEEEAGSEALLHLKPLTTLASIGLFLKDIDKEEFKERAKTYDEVVSLLENRDYPSHKFAKRVIANTTSDVESRRMVRELYRQAGNIDSSKWYNQAGEIIGAMTPAMVVGRGGFGTARAFGAGRLAASRIAQNVAKGYIGAEMAGQYAEETAAQYLERTGDKKFENFTPKDATGLTAAAYGAIGAQIEFMGGVEPIFAGALNKVGLKSGLLKAGVKIGAGEATEEFLQGMTETLLRKIDGSSNKTWGEGFRDALNGAAWGLFIGGSLGTMAFHTNRANLVKGIKQAIPGVTDTQATQLADVMAENTAEISSQDPTLRANLREKVALMYRDSDIDNKENIIDATTDLEYGLIAMDSAERGVNIADNPIFAGEVNELGWFRDVIPENRRAEVQAINDEIKGLKEQLAEEQKKEEKDWAKIDDLENKLARANEYVLDKLSDLVRNDAAAVRRMLRKTEGKFVKTEKERATKKAIKSGNVDIISEILSQAGFKTRDMSGKQIKELARLNWELLQDKDLGLSTSAVQRKMADVEANVESGNAVLLRAGYTQEMIDKMDDETWNRAILTQYRKEAEKPVEEPDINFDEIPDDWFAQEQFDLADENARLDEKYPEYDGETINIDGKERSVYNSNGDRIAKSKEALTNFWNWFGDSKVVDEQGRPLVVYHGARGKSDITEFRPQEYGYNVEATYFATNKRAAGHWAEASYTKRNINPDEYMKRVYKTDSVKELLDMYNSFGAKTEIVEYDGFYRLNEHDGMISSPLGKKITESKFEVNGRTVDLVKELQRKISRIVYDSANSDLYSVYAKLDNPLVVDAKKNPYWKIEYDGTTTNTETIATKAKAQGYDGVIIKNVLETDYENVLTDDVMVFDSTQIKSVDNRGTFSSDTGNIYWQTGYAGSAVDYDRPSLEAIGSGEGVQAHGWGLYYALNPEIAENYMLASRASYEANKIRSLDEEFETLKVEGKPILDVYDIDIDRTLLDLLTWKPYGVVEEELEKRISKWEQLSKDPDYKFKDYADKKVNAYKKLKSDLYNNGMSLIQKDRGQVHEVDIPEMDYLLDEQKMLIDQSEFVQKKIWEINDKLNLGIKDSGIRGSLIYYKIAEKASKDGYSEKAASQLLDKYGIKGITYDGRQDGRCFVIFNPESVKVLRKKFDELGNVLFQNRVSGAAPKTYRGAYIPEYRFILRANRMDASTLSHELAHDWMEVNFARYRDGKASKEFMRAWGALEKALGIPENATRVPAQASETFARAYEAWIMTNEDWAKLINVEDKDKDAIEKLLKDYQGELRNIYNDMTSKYFKETWGSLGELKPELKAWFDRAVNITDLDVLAERGEITEEEASAEKLNRAIDTVIENTADEETTQALKTFRTLNDTKRYEVEGGNKNSLQNRLSNLAREIDENNMLLKEKYDTHRDMLKVAEAADNFVKTRLDDALAIINGEMAEVEGLYKEDIYTALERLAVENGDMNLISELKNSEIANRLAKELGQRVAGFRNFKSSTDIDVVSALKSLDSRFNEALKNKKAKEQFNSALDLLNESLENQDKVADKQLDSMLKEWECQ